MKSMGEDGHARRSSTTSPLCSKDISGELQMPSLVKNNAVGEKSKQEPEPEPCMNGEQKMIVDGGSDGKDDDVTGKDDDDT